ncbi:MAG: prepilin peptidase [Archaeoglobus sp.]|nr:prepilin peptidase [Archaeoglobus sp.]
MILNAIYLVKCCVVAIFLLYASVLDLRERRVPNRLWKFMVLAVIPLVVAEFFALNPDFYQVIFAALQFALMFGLAFGLYYLGAYGGADAKALMVLSLLFPFYPTLNFQSLSLPLLNSGFGVFAFSALSNSVISAPGLVVILFLRNLLKEGLKELKGNVFYYFIGYRADASNLPRFHNLLEYVDSKGKVVRLRRGIEPDEEILYRLKKAYDKGKVKRIWVTPGMPFLVFFTAGYLISIFVGNLLFELIFILMKM